MGYDTESGLVYDETVVSAKPCQCLAKSMAINNPSRLKPSKNQQGALSMQETAVLNVLRNIEGLRGDDLIAVLGSAPLLVQKLWRRVVAKRLDTLPVWKAFAHVEEAGIRQSCEWEYACQRCAFSKLPRILQLVDSPTFTWLSDLTIEGPPWQLSSQDLMHLTHLTNLRNIHVCGSREPGVGLTDHVVEAWAHAAEKQGAFPRLRSMLLQGQYCGLRNISHWSLGKMHYFPALEVFGLINYKIDTKYTDRRIGNFVPTYSRELKSSALGIDGFIIDVTMATPSFQGLNSFRNHPDVWFERESTPWVPTAGEITPWDFELSRPAARPVKLRKVRDGKTRQLAQMMDGLI